MNVQLAILKKIEELKMDVSVEVYETVVTLVYKGHEYIKFYVEGDVSVITDWCASDHWDRWDINTSGEIKYAGSYIGERPLPEYLKVSGLKFVGRDDEVGC